MYLLVLISSNSLTSRHIVEYMSSEVTHVLTLEDWDDNFDQVRNCKRVEGHTFLNETLPMNKIDRLTILQFSFSLKWCEEEVLEGIHFGDSQL